MALLAVHPCWLFVGWLKSTEVGRKFQTAVVHFLQVITVLECGMWDECVHTSAWELLHCGKSCKGNRAFCNQLHCPLSHSQSFAGSWDLWSLSRCTIQRLVQCVAGITCRERQEMVGDVCWTLWTTTAVRTETKWNRKWGFSTSVGPSPPSVVFTMESVN